MAANSFLEEQLQVHGSDSPGTQLVGILLNETNFLIWRSAVESTLEAKLKLGFVDGSLEKPKEDTKLFLKCKRANSLVFSWLKGSMIPELMRQFMFVHDARQLWIDLEGRFGTTSLPRLFELRRTIATLRQGTASVGEHFGKLKQIWDQYKQLRTLPHIEGEVGLLLKTRENEDRVMEYLMGLNETYEYEKSQILCLDPLPHLDKVYNMIVTAEKHRQVSNNMATGNDDMSAALIARGIGLKTETSLHHNTKFNKGEMGNIICQHCGRTSHTIDVCYKLKGRSECTHCGRKGHTVDTCYQLKGYPGGRGKQKPKSYNTANQILVQDGASSQATPLDFKAEEVGNLYEIIGQMQRDIQRFTKGKSMAGQLDTMTVNMAHYDDFAGTTIHPHLIAFVSASIMCEDWIIDTVATNHMCTDLSMMSKLCSFKSLTLVYLPDGIIKPVFCRGNVTLKNFIFLDSCLYIPSFKHNLLSVRKLLLSTDISSLFLPNLCAFQDLRTARILAVGPVVQGLYILCASSFDPKLIQHVQCLIPSTKLLHRTSRHYFLAQTELDTTYAAISPLLLHNRLGHPSFDVLKHCSSYDIVDLVNRGDLLCEICPLSKQSADRYSSSTTVSEHCFDLLHLDVWGPYNIPSITNCQFFLTIVDDKSRCTWTYLFQFKATVSQLLSSFLNLVKTQYNGTVKMIGTDNGAEFINSTCRILFQTLGIIHQRSYPYTPQQNGVVERRHRTLLQIARGLLFQSQLSKKFWGESVLTATYLLNHWPSRIVQWKSPYEILHDTKPDLSHLRAFGCVSYLLKKGPGRDKLDHRSFKGCFVSYPPNQRGYKAQINLLLFVYHHLYQQAQYIQSTLLLP